MEKKYTIKILEGAELLNIPENAIGQTFVATIEKFKIKGHEFECYKFLHESEYWRIPFKYAQQCLGIVEIFGSF